MPWLIDIETLISSGGRPYRMGRSVADDSSAESDGMMRPVRDRHDSCWPTNQPARPLCKLCGIGEIQTMTEDTKETIFVVSILGILLAIMVMAAVALILLHG